MTCKPQYIQLTLAQEETIIMTCKDYLTLRGRIKRAGSHCIRATATGVMYFPLMFDTCPGPGHVYPFDV